jgi:biotin carboxyl carrier protein
VSSVEVTAGQTVEHGDELLTIEAMKMFNVIRSPRAGTVATVHVAAGKSVAQGEPLVTFSSS